MIFKSLNRSNIKFIKIPVFFLLIYLLFMQKIEAGALSNTLCRIFFETQGQKQVSQSIKRVDYFKEPNKNGTTFSSTTSSLTVGNFRVYVPENITNIVEIQGDFTRKGMFSKPVWVPLEFNHVNQRWEISFNDLKPGQKYQFRYLTPEGEYKIFSDPMAYTVTKKPAELDSLGNVIFSSQYSVVPDLYYEWKNPNPLNMKNAIVISETPLPSLLYSYQGGKYFPSDQRELDQVSLAKRALPIAKDLKDKGFNAVMLPIQISVANLANYLWQYSYLVSSPGALDPHIGSWREFKELIDVFRGVGIIVIPDLIFVHKVKEPFVQSYENIVDANGKMLWFDSSPYKHIDYGTLMYDLEDPSIRKLLIESLIRFISEFKLEAIRYDYVDGLLLQYKLKGTNWGEVFLDEFNNILRKDFPELRVISESFEMSQHRVINVFADVKYQPWLGVKTIEELTHIPHSKTDINIDVELLKKAIIGQNLSEKPFVSMATDHDTIGNVPEIAKTRKEANNSGKHMAQLIQNRAAKLFKLGLIEKSEIMDFTVKNLILLESITMFGSNFSYLTTSHFRLGTYEKNFDVVWDPHSHPDIPIWEQITGLKGADVVGLIEKFQKSMQDLRKIFIRSTPIDFKSGKRFIEMSVPHINSDFGLFVVKRENLISGKTQMVIINFNNSTIDYEIPIIENSNWEVVFDLNENLLNQTLSAQKGTFHEAALIIPEVKKNTIIILESL